MSVSHTYRDQKSSVPCGDREFLAQFWDQVWEEHYQNWFQTDKEGEKYTLEVVSLEGLAVQK